MTSFGGAGDLPLQRGADGDTVRELQQRLQGAGLYARDCDGTFGESTELAVVELQRLFQRSDSGVFTEVELADLVVLEQDTGAEASSDGWVWDGERWAEDPAGSGSGPLDGAAAGAISEDGQWQWDGERWQTRSD
jgi:peptidoglycan hydrolase-like protein with peptidoglycan-binding domain